MCRFYCQVLMMWWGLWLYPWCHIRRMRSPVGRKAQHCAAVYEVSLEKLAIINKKSARSLLYQKWPANSSLRKINQIIELLLVKHRYAFLSPFCASEVDCLVEHSCTTYSFIFFSFCLLYFSFSILLGVVLYDVHAKQINRTGTANHEIITSSSSFLIRPKRVEYLLGKSQSVNILLKHQSYRNNYR